MSAATPWLRTMVKKSGHASIKAVCEKPAPVSTSKADGAVLHQTFGRWSDLPVGENGQRGRPFPRSILSKGLTSKKPLGPMVEHIWRNIALVLKMVTRLKSWIFSDSIFIWTCHVCFTFS